MSATSTSPARTRDISFTSRITRACPAPIFWPMLRPLTSRVERDFSVKR